ncbi:uncharacterized protein LOC143550630 [Bidens hawaiensis]|uniref:uncharacterized protein LOC143550630 n=1 Tax=Bidens hawaiensis TaxID=980011 RepID=UPI004049AAA3
MPTMNNLISLFLFLVTATFVYTVSGHGLFYSRLVNDGLEHQPHVPVGEQPLAKIAIHKAVIALHKSASIHATPFLLGSKGEDTEWVNVNFEYPEPTNVIGLEFFHQQSSMHQIVILSPVTGQKLYTYALPQ